MSQQERRDAIGALRDAREGTTVIAYVTSTRPGLEGQMGLDAISQLYRHLRALDQHQADERRIDLFLHSNGGEGIVPWRLVTLVREYCSEFTVLVPHHAFSAATLTALGADKVLMHPMGMLGPTDPSISGPFNPPDPRNPMQVLPVSVEDVSSYIDLVRDDVGIRHEDELVQTFLALADKVHPLTLGSVKRTTSQSRMLGEKLLRRRNQPMPQSTIEEVVRKLTSELFFHGHPINSREAREDVGLDFVEDAPPEVAEAMWQLYEVYRADLKLEAQFSVLQEAIAKNPLPVPAAPAPLPAGMALPGMPVPMVAPAQATVRLDPLRFAFVESAPRTDVYEAECEVTVLRDSMGNYQAGAPQFLSQQWTEEVPAAPAAGAAPAGGPAAPAGGPAAPAGGPAGAPSTGP